MEWAQPDALTLLNNARVGDAEAASRLAALLDGELRELLSRHMRLERQGSLLRPSVLLNAVFTRMAEERDVGWEKRAQFMGIAARVMRQVMVSYARDHRSRRGLGPAVLPMEEELAYSEESSDALLALDSELERLALVNAQQASIMELRFFGGLSVEETAEVVGMPARTVKREWGMARVWLHRRMVARH